MSYLLASKLLAGFTYPAHGMSVAVRQGTHYLISHSYEYNTHLCNGVCLYNIVTNMFIMIQGNQQYLLSVSSGAHNGAEVRKIGAGIAHAFN